MGQEKKPASNSRRKFLSLFNITQHNAADEKVKLLTADGKLMEVDRSILEKVATKKKASNKEILEWMQNPSKEK